MWQWVSPPYLTSQVTPSIKLGRIGKYFKATFEFQNLAILNVTLPDWVKCENECYHRIWRPKCTRKTCITWHSCYIFIRRPHLTWPWPCRLLALASYLYRIFVIPSVALWWSPLALKPAAIPVLGLVSADDKVNVVSPDPIFDLFKR